MIVWLASFPRSGNTLFRSLLWSLCGVKTHSVHNDPMFSREGFGEEVGHQELSIHRRTFFAHRDKPQESIKHLVAEDHVYFVKTHAQAGQTPFDAPAIYIVRDGRDAEVSFSHYQTWKLGRESFEKRLRRRVTEDSIWGPHVMSWWGKSLVTVRFEDLIEQPVPTVRIALKRAGLPIDTIPGREPVSFDMLHKKSPGFFRRGEIGCYKDEMPEDLQEVFWERFGEALTAYGYEK